MYAELIMLSFRCFHCFAFCFFVLLSAPACGGSSGVEEEIDPEETETTKVDFPPEYPDELIREAAFDDIDPQFLWVVTEQCERDIRCFRTDSDGSAEVEELIECLLENPPQPTTLTLVQGLMNETVTVGTKEAAEFWEQEVTGCKGQWSPPARKASALALRGTKAEGKSCFASSECASEWCQDRVQPDSDAILCDQGTCAPKERSLGEPCLEGVTTCAEGACLYVGFVDQGGWRCSSTERNLGERCWEGTTTCLQGECVGSGTAGSGTESYSCRLGVGEACDPAVRRQCENELECLEGSCTAIPERPEPVGINESCEANPCEEGSFCNELEVCEALGVAGLGPKEYVEDRYSGGEVAAPCEDGLFTTRAFCFATDDECEYCTTDDSVRGMTCEQENEQCSESLFCLLNDQGDYVCREQVAVGESCAVDRRAARICEGKAKCSPATEICVEPMRRDQSCSEDLGCYSERCVEGMCAPREYRACDGELL